MTTLQPPGYFTPESGAIDVTFVTIGIMLSLVAFFGNLGTILAFCTDKRAQRKPSDFMILSLACADFGMAISVLPLRLVTINIFAKWPFGDIGCRCMVFVEMTLLTAGIMFVILISFDRYQMLALDYTDYLKRWDTRKVVKIIAFTWSVSLLPGIFEIATWDVTLVAIPESLRPNFNYSCSNPSSWRTVTNIICITFVAVIPTSTVSLLGVLIVLKLHRRLKQWRKVGVTSLKKSGATGAPEISTIASGGFKTNGSTVSTEVSAMNHDGTSSIPRNGYDVGTDQNGHSGESQDETSKSHGRMRQPLVVMESEAKANHSPQQTDTALCSASTTNPTADSKQKSNPAGKSNSQSNEVIHNRYIKPVITYICLVLCITVCNFPISIYALLLSTSCPHCYNPTLISCLVALMYFTSCLNPLLYALTNAKIRAFYVRQWQHVVKACVART